jgi:uncharacterized sporulation protein YeaH/YhbH (DUF444 family)
MQRIKNDHQEFRDVISGRFREELKKYISTGKIFKNRSNKNGGISIPIPKINLPHIVYGSQNSGVGRGEGKEGDVVGYEPKKGAGKGNQAGEEEGEGMIISVDMNDVIDLLIEDLKLPRLMPKTNQTFEESIIKYNNVSKVGPKSLIHKRRSIKECMKRMISIGEWTKKKKLPGFNIPITPLNICNDDFRYRQWNEIKKPASNAVIFFARDGSGSMDQTKCDIVSDMAWWLDLWIRKDYKKTDRVYIWHDVEAKELSESDFYSLRYGGGTVCSSSLKLIKDIIKIRYPKEKYNIYIFYFGDGDNLYNDNKVFCDLIKNEFNDINLFGLTQIKSYGYNNSLKFHVDERVANGFYGHNHIVRTTSIGQGIESEIPTMEEESNKLTLDIKNALKDLLSDAKSVN